MELINLIKEWAGLTLVIGGAIWGIVELFLKYYKQKEDVKQTQQQTEQAKLDTDEKALDLDSRRVRASEEVASEALEDMAEARRENLKLLESDYEKSKAIIEMQAEIKSIKARVYRLEEEKVFLEENYCSKDCGEREPPKGTFRVSCISITELRKMMSDGKTI